MILSEYKKHPDAKLKPRLFWDIDLNKLDFRKAKHFVVERVVEHGGLEDWWAMLNMYGKDAVQQEIKNIPMLTDRNIKFVSGIFGIPVNEMKSYQNKLAGKKHWRE